MTEQTDHEVAAATAAADTRQVSFDQARADWEAAASARATAERAQRSRPVAISVSSGRLIPRESPEEAAELRGLVAAEAEAYATMRFAGAEVVEARQRLATAEAAQRWYASLTTTE